MADRILAGTTALESVAVDVSWDDVVARLTDDDLGDGDAPRLPAAPSASGTGAAALDDSDRLGSSRVALRLVVAAAAAVLLVVVVLATGADEDAGIATQPNTVGTVVEPAPPPTETTAPSTTPTTYSTAELYEQARKDLLRTKLHEDLIAHLGDRYGGGRYDGNDLVVLVKGLTPADQEWLSAQSPTGVIRLEATDFSRSEFDQAQTLVNAELPTWAVESWSTGQRIDPPALSVVVQGHHEGLEARLRSLVAVPLIYAETDEAVGIIGGDVLPADPG